MSKKAICQKCGKEVDYKEIQIPIKYSINDKQHVLINGIDRICSVCGWSIDTPEVTQINAEIAAKSTNYVTDTTASKETDTDTISDKVDTAECSEENNPDPEDAEYFEGENGQLSLF